MKTTKRTPTVGSVSTATMLASDLIPAFLDELEYLGHKRRAAHIRREYWKRGEYPADDWYDTEDASYMLETLFDALNNYALPYMYFGAHPGDSADYGWWIDVGSAEEDALKVDAGDQWPPLKERPDYILEVNDHGNATLYTRRHKEIWAVV